MTKRLRGRQGSVAQLAATTYATTALGLLTGPIVARALGPAGRGAYQAVLVYSTISTHVLALGLSVAVVHALTVRRVGPERLLGCAIRFCICMAPVAALAALTITTVLLTDLPSSARWAAGVFVLMSPLSIFSLLLTAFLLARSALRDFAIASAAPFVMNASAVVGLASMGSLTLTTYVVATGVTAVASLALLFGLVNVRPAPGGSIRDLLRFGMRAYPGSLANITNVNLDQALMVPVLGAQALGHYAVAVSLAYLPLGLTQALGARIIGTVNRPSGEFRFEDAAFQLRRVVLVAVMAISGMAVVVPTAVPLLYGSAFAPSVSPALLLMPGILGLAVSGVAGSLLVNLGRPGANSAAQLVSLAITVLGLVLFLDAGGISAAATVSSIAYLVRCAIQVTVLRSAGLRGMVPRGSDIAQVARVVWAVTRRRR